MSTGAEVTKKGISRRDLIKKGAVAGAVFWSVPVIESVTSAAAAGSGFPCSWAVFVYWNSSTQTYYVDSYQGSPAGFCILGSMAANEGSTPATAGTTSLTIAFNQKTVVITDTSNSSNTLTINLPGGSGKLGGTASTTCPGNVSFSGGTTFSVPSPYTFIAVNYWQPSGSGDSGHKAISGNTFTVPCK